MQSVTEWSGMYITDIIFFFVVDNDSLLLYLHPSGTVTTDEQKKPKGGGSTEAALATGNTFILQLTSEGQITSKSYRNITLPMQWFSLETNAICPYL